MLPGLPDDWRPDKSGILVNLLRPEDIVDDAVPAGYSRDAIIQFLLLRDDAIERYDFAEVVGMFLAANVPAYRGVCGPTGYGDAKVFLNEATRSPMSRRDREGVMSVVRKALAVAKRYNFEPLS